MFFTCLSSSGRKMVSLLFTRMCEKKTITATQLVITDMLQTETCETACFQGTKDLS